MSPIAEICVELVVPRGLTVLVGVHIDLTKGHEASMIRALVSPSPTAALTPPVIATSVVRGTEPEPSATVPPLITTSCSAVNRQ